MTDAAAQKSPRSRTPNVERNRHGFPALIASAAMAFSFRQIQYFVAAAENGAVSRAAHELSISQSTVAEAIRELEGDLGFPLFERKAQGVELTLKGNQFLRHALKILADVAEARRALRSDQTAVAGQLELGVTPLVAGYVLAEILARFRRAFPAVGVQIVEDGRSYLEHLLVNGELDVAVVVAGAEKNVSALKIESVETSRYRVWLPTGHALADAEQHFGSRTHGRPARAAQRRRDRRGGRGGVPSRRAFARQLRSAPSRSKRRAASSRPVLASLCCPT